MVAVRWRMASAGAEGSLDVRKRRTFQPTSAAGRGSDPLPTVTAGTSLKEISMTKRKQSVELHPGETIERLTLSGFDEINFSESCCGSRLITADSSEPGTIEAECEKCGARYSLTIRTVSRA